MTIFQLSTSLPLMFLQDSVLTLDPNAIVTQHGSSIGTSPTPPIDSERLSITNLVEINSDILTQGQVDALSGSGTAVWNRAAITRYKASRSFAKTIPNWATWSQTDLLTWFNANISSTQINAATTLAQLKVISIKQSSAILSIGQLLIAFRDYQWPDLQDR